jgi:transcriptional regulator with XRE-family HTH domain
MDESLDTEVKALLEAHKGQWQSIATKADVSYSWLSKFVNGKIDNPGYATLKRLRDCLAKPSTQPAQA